MMVNPTRCVRSGISVPKEDVAFAEVWCNLKRKGKSDEEIFNTIKAMRKKGELRDRKQNSSWALRKRAEDYYLPELLDMELELERHHIEEHIDAAGGVNHAT